MRPTPSVQQRAINTDRLQEALAAGYGPIAARVVAARVPANAPSLDKLISPSMALLESPDGLPDIDSAANRIAMAVTQGEIISTFSDYDVDGCGFSSVWHDTLLNHFHIPKHLLRVYQGYRLTEGYGLTDAAVSRILADSPRPGLVLLGDCGSSDEPRIAKLAARGTDTCVFDHHILPVEGPPKSAFACVSPLRVDSAYSDRSICGAVVGWLGACATRRVLMDIQYLKADAPKLTDMLPYLALASVADCMSLATSPNTRMLIRHGLNMMNTSDQPCWQVARSQIAPQRCLTETDLAFTLAAYINAAGRVEDARRGLNFLLSKTVDEAYGWWQLLRQQNNQRREIERTLLLTGDPIAAAEVSRGRCGLVVYLENGHPGVHGIVAQRLMQAYGRPVVCLSPKLSGGTKILSGSARSSHGVNLKEAFQYVADHAPGLVLHHGGHAAAGGCEITFSERNIAQFADLFDAAVRQSAQSDVFGPVLWTDGPLAARDISLDTINELDTLRPYGKDFEAPTFDSRLRVDSVKPIGDGSHLRLRLSGDGHKAQAVWFRAIAPGSPLPVTPRQDVQVLYSLEDNFYNGTHAPQINIKAIFPLA